MTRTAAYFDWNASAPLLPAARAAVDAALDAAANPSSVHEPGRAARRMIEEARRQVAALVNARAENVVFTSGATEAAEMALTPDYRMGRAPLRFSKLYVCAADHPCTLSGGRFDADNVIRFAVDGDGVVDLSDLKTRLRAHDRDAGLPMVALQWVNNETGVIQPIGAVAAMVHEFGGVLVADAVQAAGRIKLDLSEGWADYLILSAHKIGGPLGAGAFVSASDITMPVPLITGGGQEKGHRGGTENLPGIAGFGVAAQAAREGLDGTGWIAALRDRIEVLVEQAVPDVVFYGRNADRVANTTCFSIPGMKAETAQIAFDLAGVAVSAGSACSSGRTGPSHVMAAMGKGEESALRVSIGVSTGEAELEVFEDALKAIAGRRKKAADAA